MNTIDLDAEQFIRDEANRIFMPEEGECLACYVSRLLVELGCDHSLRFARSFRDQRAPRASSLERTLRNSGGFCDCEVLWNVFEPAAALWSQAYWEEDADGHETWVDAEPPEKMPPCATVRRGSTKPCTQWQRQRRDAW